MSGKKQCITCNKSGGIMTCDGCGEKFCVKHSIEHRQQLAYQLDGIMQEHDILQQELGQSFKDHCLFAKIDKWEKESIVKIQTAAEASRMDLRVMIENSRERLSRACHDIAVNLRLTREADDYFETDLNQWMKQLEELKFNMSSSLSLKMIENEWASIRLITIQGNDTSKYINHSCLKRMLASVNQERFSRVIGNVTLDEEGLLAKHTSDDWNYEYVLGEQLYSESRHTILFKIERSGTPYNIFFGCISSQTIQNRISMNSPYTVGWFGYNQVYQHGTRIGNSNLHGYNSNEIATNDVLHLTFDCDKRRIELFHEDSNKRHILRINTSKMLFPWQLLVVLTDKDDCVRILTTSKLNSMNKIQTEVSIE